MNRDAAQDQILRDFFRLLRRQWLVIFLTTLLAVGAAIAYSVLKTPEYEATAELQFIDQSEYLPQIGIGTSFTGVDPAKRAAQDAERVTSSQVVDAVKKDVKTDLTLSEIKDSVKTAVNPDNNLVALSVRAKSATLATDLANAFASETRRVLTNAERNRLISTAKSLEDGVKKQDDTSILKQQSELTAARLRSVAEVARPVEIASPAEKPGSPVSPKPVRDTVLALILGLIFGTLLAFLRDSLDRRLKDAHDVQRELQIPLLGYVDAAALGNVRLPQNGSGKAPDRWLEPFRILRSNVDFLAPNRQVQTLAVTSPVAEEGKSTVAAGLAAAAALAGKRVLLVECDLRRPVFAERLEVPAAPGFTDWLSGAAEPADVIRQVAVDRRGENGDGGANGNAGDDLASMTVISAGNFSSHPAELLASGRFAEFITEVKQVYELVVLDCAPLLPVGDTLEVLPHADAALLCIRLDQTTRDQALAAKGAIEHLPERPVGLVLTGVRAGRDGYYYGYYSSRAPSQPAIVVQPPNAG
jgi:capsular polysaccharide biosynthesis protein/Mrp family chromosome partitioning ATPase